MMERCPVVMCNSSFWFTFSWTFFLWYFSTKEFQLCYFLRCVLVSYYSILCSSIENVSFIESFMWNSGTIESPDFGESSTLISILYSPSGLNSFFYLFSYESWANLNKLLLIFLWAYLDLLIKACCSSAVFPLKYLLFWIN